MGTNYPKSAQTGDEGVAIVQQITFQGGGIFRPYYSPDVGIDGTIEFLTDEREPSGDLVLVQIKCGRSYIRGDRFYLNADREHFKTWARYAVPVLGIVCDPDTSEARWVDITSHLSDNPLAIDEGPYSIEAPKTNLFSVAEFPTHVDHAHLPTLI